MRYPCTGKRARGPPPHRRSARSDRGSVVRPRCGWRKRSQRHEEEQTTRGDHEDNDRRKKRLGAELPRDSQAFGNRNHIVTRAGATNAGTPARLGKSLRSASSTPPRRGGRYVYSTRLRRKCA